METMCNGELLNKDTADALEYLDSLVENSQVWETKDISNWDLLETTPIARSGF